MSDYPFQPIVNIAEICARKNVRTVVLSPGSRCAPLTIAFARHPQIRTLTITDERSAAFIGMGMAQQARETVVLVCTSGSAGLNYAAAVAEAFYQQVPLLVITADRPPEWIDQLDGQTVRQRDMFGRHCKASYELPVDYTHKDAIWQIERVVSEAINTSRAYPQGPVHINAPFREPFYPAADQQIRFDVPVKVIDMVQSVPTLDWQTWEELKAAWTQYTKILVVGGQNRFDDLLCAHVEELGVPALSDVISNLHRSRTAIRYHEMMLSSPQVQETLGAPDLLITFGKSVISKNVKTFLRKYAPAQHWHIQPSGNGWAVAADTYKSLTKIIPVDPVHFFQNIVQTEPLSRELADARYSYLEKWRNADHAIFRANEQFLYGLSTFSEFGTVAAVMKALPDHSTLHLANSMTVRYANFLNLESHRKVEVFANRGTSGIDGSTSTAVGHSFCSSQLHTLITGDLAFIYDRNALWNNYPAKNLRIVVLNNHGGGIFKMIDGPGNQPESDEYFVTRQPLNARRTAEDAGLEYVLCSSRDELDVTLKTFFEDDGKSKLLEVETSMESNQEVWKAYKSIKY